MSRRFPRRVTVQQTSEIVKLVYFAGWTAQWVIPVLYVIAKADVFYNDYDAWDGMLQTMFAWFCGGWFVKRVIAKALWLMLNG